MQRLTITIDDDLVAEVDNFIAKQGYANRSEAFRDLLRSGEPLARSLSGRMRLAVAGFAGGGLAALEAIERANFDVLAGSPRPSGTRRLGSVAAAMIRALGGFRVVARPMAPPPAAGSA